MMVQMEVIQRAHRRAHLLVLLVVEALALVAALAEALHAEEGNLRVQIVANDELDEEVLEEGENVVRKVAVGAHLHADRLQGGADKLVRAGNHEADARVADHVRADVVGKDRLDDDAAVFVLGVQRPGEVVHVDLAGAVHGQQRSGKERRVGADVDDDARAALLHQRQDNVRHAGHREDVAVENVADELVRVGDLREVLRVLVRHADVVDEDVDVAVEGVDLLGDGFVDRVEGKVDGHRLHSRAVRTLGDDFRLDLVELLGSTADEEKAVALAGHRFGVGEADAVGATGDNGPAVGAGSPLGAKAEQVADKVGPEGLDELDHRPEGDQEGDAEEDEHRRGQ